jgi:hypothetical protein
MTFFGEQIDEYELLESLPAALGEKLNRVMDP